MLTMSTHFTFTFRNMMKIETLFRQINGNEEKKKKNMKNLLANPMKFTTCDLYYDLKGILSPEQYLLHMGIWYKQQKPILNHTNDDYVMCADLFQSYFSKRRKDIKIIFCSHAVHTHTSIHFLFSYYRHSNAFVSYLCRHVQYRSVKLVYYLVVIGFLLCACVFISFFFCFHLFM